MRRVLIDAARRKKSAKCGGDLNKVQLDEIDVSRKLAKSIVDLNEAVDEFEKVSPEKAELVRLRYFLGMSETEAAESMGISRATASRYWNYARAWLLANIAGE
jgi:RNA polymerase sigma factor (TIGR02999 family)